MAPITNTTTGSSGKHGPHKVSLACNFCRSRKRKCDGARPICGYCRTMKNDTCKFDVHSDKRKPASRVYVSGLEARIKLLEKVLRETPGAIMPPELFEATDTDEDRGQSNNGMSPRDEGCHVCFTTSDTEGTATLPEDSGASVEAIIDMGRLRLCISKTDKGDTMNEGDSSNFSYHGPSPSCFPGGLPARPTIRELSVDFFQGEHELKLLNAFWIWQDIHFTVVERTLFLRSYNDGERDSEWVSPMLIDMMLAIGEQFGNVPVERKAMYADRAAQWVVHEMERPRMATMYAIQLLAIYQMGTGKIGAGWSLMSLATTLSSRLGLHLDSTDLVVRGKMTNEMKTVRDLALWGVFMQDRVFSIIMGVNSIHSRRSLSTRRPAGGISASIVPYLTLAGGEPNKVARQDTLSTRRSAQLRLRDLADIAESMLLDIYSYDASRSVMEDYNLVIKNASVMKSYMGDLPASIKAESCAGDNLQAVSLHLFINLFIIMINRPFIGPHRSSTSSSGSQPVPLSSTADLTTERRYRSLAFNYSRTAALRIISLIGLIIHSPCSSTAYDIFAASTILLLSPQDPETMAAVRAGLELLDQQARGRYWPEAAEDSKRRIWALAERWHVPLLDEYENTESSAYSSLNTSPHSSVDTSFAVAQLPWPGFQDPVVWDTLPACEAAPGVFTGPDAGLFATCPSADLSTMYSDVSIPTHVVQWDPTTWGYLGLQPGEPGIGMGEGVM